MAPPLCNYSLSCNLKETLISAFSMDFHSLARRELQFLCKKNGIPANLTNVAMAKALEALETVEAIEVIQDALGLQSRKVNSLNLPQSGRKNFSRGVAHGDESKIQETLEFQSLKEKSPEHPHTGQRTSVRRAVAGEEMKVQQQKQSPLHQSHQAAAEDLEASEMAFKKEVPVKLSKTPATRKSAKGVEAQSTKRRANKNKKVEGHTETPMEVDAKGGKAIGVVTRRSTRLSSRKALEEMATTQSKSRRGRKENSAIKMGSLAKEDMEEQEKEEEKKSEICD